jgi:hypothetical protein
MNVECKVVPLQAGGQDLTSTFLAAPGREP